MKSGYLEKESLNLKILRKRWIVLKEKNLYCYKDKSLNNLTEKINLTLFNDIKQIKNDKTNQFELISKKQKRIFVAQTIKEMNEWIKIIKYIINNNNNKNKTSTGLVYINYTK